MIAHQLETVKLEKSNNTAPRKQLKGNAFLSLILKKMGHSLPAREFDINSLA